MLLLLITLLSSYAFHVEALTTCNAQTSCAISSNCRCSSVVGPLSDNVDNSPQLISITIAEAISDDTYTNLWNPLLFSRTNPDGAPISATFFVPHEYTNYSSVNQLYNAGFEIGVNSVTNNALASYWSKADLDTLTSEFSDQRQIISTFANIPIDDIIGARTPQLQIEGDVSIEAYLAAGLSYDNSWTTRNNARFFPYTLDNLSTQECRTGTTCPEDAHNGFWILPIINIQGNDSIECNSFSICNMEGSASDLSTWLTSEIDRFRTTTKAPLSLMLSSSWFRFTDNSYDAFAMVLDNLQKDSDVYLVSLSQTLDWIKNPTTLDQFKTADTSDRDADCTLHNCQLTNSDGQFRYMPSCVTCPSNYPWLGNPTGEDQSR